MTEFEKTLSLEGGYTNDPNDPGGETKYGISKRAYPSLDIANLTQDQAFAIYKTDYWDKLHCDGYSNIQYRWKLFDIAFNQGIGTAMAFIPKVQHPDSIQGVVELVKLQMLRYVGIVISHPTQISYLRGWTNRAMETGDDLV